MLAAFVAIELRVPNPLFDLSLFRIRAFTLGNTANLLASLGRGGLQFVLIIWLQGIWLPQHGYSFEETPLWAGIYMLPLTVGFLVAGPLSGVLSDRMGPRWFSTGGMLLTAASFVLLELLARRLLLPRLRRAAPAQRRRHGPVLLAQPGRGDEQPPGERARRRAPG